MLFIREVRETLGRFSCNRGFDGRAAAVAAIAGCGLTVVNALTALVEFFVSVGAASPAT